MKKYSGLKRKHRILLEELHKDLWCDSMKVSKEFYLRVEKGSEVEYVTKRGYLGVKWLYHGLRIIEE